MNHLHFNFWDEWLLNHKAVFDGPTRTITIEPNTIDIDIKIDLYSAWKDWTRIRDNLKFLQAFRSTGGDPLPGGLQLGSTYFLMNGWRIILDHGISFNGNLYTEEGASPFVTASNVEVAISTVSTLVERVEIPAELQGVEIAEAVWEASVDSSPPQSAGYLLKEARDALIAVATTVAAGSTNRIVNLSSIGITNNFFNNHTIQIFDGSYFASRTIEQFGSDGVVILSSDLPFVPSVGARVNILARISAGVAGVA